MFLQDSKQTRLRPTRNHNLHQHPLHILTSLLQIPHTMPLMRPLMQTEPTQGPVIAILTKMRDVLRDMAETGRAQLEGG